MDIDNVEPASTKREFLAVLVAGFGNGLLPLTSDHGDDPCPKALLPVANKPLIEYVLSWLEQSGITDVLLICPAIHHPALYHHIHSDVSSSPLRIDLQTYEETQESPAGTCELLRHFANRITEDFVVVPCDFIAPPDLPLSELLNKFRVECTLNDTLVTTCWLPAHTPEKNILSDEWGPSPSPPPIVWDKATSTLLHVDTPDDLDRNGEELELNMGLVSRFPRTKLSSSFIDSHVYICQKKLLPILQQQKKLESFREDFLPWLCKNQYKQTDLNGDGKANETLPHTIVSQSPALEHSTSIQTTSISVATEDQILATKDEDNAEPATDIAASPKPNKVSIVTHRSDAGQALRINTIYNFLEVNRHFLTSVSYALPTDPKNRSLIDQKAAISVDTIIGESTQVSEKTNIKKSVIGKHCVIGKFVKISGCVLLDHCMVEDGAKLDGCILGKSTKVGAKAELVRCISAAGFEVSSGDILKGEKLVISDWTADPKSEDESGGETTDDSDDSE
ncbi:nucleotide-diphospho-sugar transferase [Coprinopsis marcescibilis]|uniref:Translation initiation factor eIF2B subunit gamma n=1 Tax=Coprinopsis marcescibilis TaxID=230819 RepID=A0A5C3KQE4_COPMA|nr:nucleotide-diphospho-sugar transferase [Coprinopsis marcescibilis]